MESYTPIYAQFADGYNLLQNSNCQLSNNFPSPVNNTSQIDEELHEMRTGNLTLLESHHSEHATNEPTMTNAGSRVMYPPLHVPAHNIPESPTEIPSPSTLSNSMGLSSKQPLIDVNPKSVTVATVCESTQVEDTRNTRPGRLRTLLENDSGGQAIVLKYDRDKLLNNKLRNRLTRIIIKVEKDKFIQRAKEEGLKEFIITTRRFLYLTHEITTTFPRETPSTYYTPYESANGVTIDAGGKLWHNYNYSKKIMREEGTLESKKNETSQQQVDEIIPVSMKNKLESLMTLLDPWTSVVLLWDETYQARQNDYITKKTPVSEYLRKYACLRVDGALTLFEADFCKIHPGSTLSLTGNWVKTTAHLLLRLKNKGISDSRDQALLEKIPQLKEEFKTAIYFYLLPYLIPSNRPGRKRKAAIDKNASVPPPARRLSVQDRRDAFFAHFPNVIELEEILRAGKQHTAKQSLQHHPVPIIVGPLHAVSAVYIILEDQLYEVDTVLKAFDLTLKICFSLHCKYPPNSRPLWIFLQQAYYNIREKDDKPPSEVNALIGEIKAIISESEKSSN